ncbi:MAG: hypothetical protein K8R60_05865 [Burkholderiales bacterium]|nr:hypothetical protein [Burkholderiales bacterium]
MRSSRSSLFRIESLAAVIAGLAAALPLAAAAAEARTGQIYQQRAADGRIVLTDRPSATAVTERTWLVEREDPATAAQRAMDVRREAEAVSERVQRRIEAQERLAAADQERAWQMQREQQTARYEDYYPAYGYAGTYPNRPFRYTNTKPPFFELGTQNLGFGNPPKRPMPHPSRPGRVSAPASP